MKYFLSHAFAIITGMLMVPVAAMIIYQMKSEEIAARYNHKGKVVAVTHKHQYYNCEYRGFMMIKLEPMGKMVVMCGVSKKPGEKISLTLDRPSDFLIQYSEPKGFTN